MSLLRQTDLDNPDGRFDQPVDAEEQFKIVQKWKENNEPWHKDYKILGMIIYHNGLRGGFD